MQNNVASAVYQYQIDCAKWADMKMARKKRKKRQKKLAAEHKHKKHKKPRVADNSSSAFESERVVEGNLPLVL